MKHILTAFLLIDKYITCIPFFRFKQNMQLCYFYYSCTNMASSFSTFCFILRIPFTFRHATTSNIIDAFFKEHLLYINETTNPHNGNETLQKKPQKHQVQIPPANIHMENSHSVLFLYQSTN